MAAHRVLPPSSCLQNPLYRERGAIRALAAAGQTLPASMLTDTLSDVLRAVRLHGAIFFSIDGCAPWVAQSPAAEVIAPHLLPGVEHMIEYHVVTRGSCWGGLLDQPL